MLSGKHLEKSGFETALVAMWGVNYRPSISLKNSQRDGEKGGKRKAERKGKKSGGGGQGTQSLE